MNDIKKLLGRLPSNQVKDPFNKACITDISMFMQESLFKGNPPTFKAIVYFRNGSTKGEQHIEGENMYDLYNKVYEFCLSLK